MWQLPNNVVESLHSKFCIDRLNLMASRRFKWTASNAKKNMKWCNHENHEHHQDQTLLAQCRARKAANGQQCNKCSTPALRFEDGSTDTWQYLATASQGLASFGQAPWKWLHTQPVICAGSMIWCSHGMKLYDVVWFACVSQATGTATQGLPPALLPGTTKSRTRNQWQSKWNERRDVNQRPRGFLKAWLVLEYLCNS